MNLMNFLKNTSEHTYVPSLDKFPMYVVNRFYSFNMRPCAQVINQFVNYQHWMESDSELQQRVLHQILPKRNYQYNKLFGGYVKKIPVVKDEKLDVLVDYVMKYFLIPSKEAKEYLKNVEFREEVEKLVS